MCDVSKFIESYPAEFKNVGKIRTAIRRRRRSSKRSVENMKKEEEKN